MDDLTEIAKLIDTLRPWLTQIVIVGGWAHRLHRFHPSANPPAYLPVTTKDADVVISSKEPMEGDIGQALKNAGFEAELRGDKTPPITHYHLGEDSKGFYAEFLTPLIGGHSKRNKEPVPLTVTMSGVTAQKLRYLELLLLTPWSVNLDSSLGIDLKAQAQVLLANPVSFVAQKILITNRRPTEKQAQDALYIHDTLDLFGTRLHELRSLWVDSVRPNIPGKTASNIEELCKDQFGKLTDIHREAVRIPQDRNISAQTFQEACAYGLREIFHSE